MQVAEILTEKFSQLPYQWVIQNDRIWRGEFSTGRVDYEVDFERNQDDRWFASFMLSHDSQRALRVGGGSSITGSGDAQAVMGTVLAMAEEWIKAVKPEVVKFSARYASRQKLYQRIFADVPGYRLVYSQPYDDAPLARRKPGEKPDLVSDMFLIRKDSDFVPRAR